MIGQKDGIRALMSEETEQATIAGMAETKVPVRCKNCQTMHYVPAYYFVNGLWYGDIRKTLNFDCSKCGWKEKIIL